MRWRSLAWLLLLVAAPVAAQPVVTSAAPEGVAVTIYRAQDRDPGEQMNLGWLQGYALVTEKRTVTIPSGRAVIRFEGVAGGLLPESAIVTGLPAGVREKNLDADLLSPRSLYARSFGRPVILRRTDPNTGTVREERAVIRSGEDGAAILQTESGFEAINCGPLFEQPVYQGVPAGLSPRPTLSIETDSPAAATVTLSLSYLAWGFDWQANYVVNLREGGDRADLTAWVTLANSDPTSFVDADMAVVAGEVNREESRSYNFTPDQSLVLHCFFRPLPEEFEPVPMPAPAAPMMEGDIVVTGMRASLQSAKSSPVTVVGEDLGDLKLYRMPIPTTVASNAQKQVAMYLKPEVKVAILYRGWIDAGSPAATSIERGLRFRNKKEDGLGVPLPSGPVAVFEPLGGTQALSGEGRTYDKAVGEEVDIALGDAEGLSASATESNAGASTRAYSVTIANAHPWPVRFEGSVRFDQGNYRIEKVSARLGRKDGWPLWKATIPANGSVTLRYRLARIRD
ncbi:hypothetical protein RZN05_20575 [Sphingomonas sp. HF-S4]|uniref:DUF4139 domain-containing protein n=1 Tax=Sphingomonas agrestis TaxID=3080540 RepID=A0ABU3YDF2_9SPHN|nr:hypothetical protein [Sphingomonas sp. HF-S4]MDV3459401.1 hypothetical protein [Sphingomonas sp. HF-S4]